MRVAFMFNVSRGGGEDEAEFDTPATVEFVGGLLRSLGHEVDAIDADVPLAELTDRLSASRPELVFNTAEARAGHFREAFFPALYEELGLGLHGLERLDVRGDAGQVAHQAARPVHRRAHAGGAARSLTRGTAAELAGLRPDGVIASVVESAAARRPTAVTA